MVFIAHRIYVLYGPKKAKLSTLELKTQNGFLSLFMIAKLFCLYIKSVTSVLKKLAFPRMRGNLRFLLKIYIFLIFLLHLILSMRNFIAFAVSSYLLRFGRI